MTALSRKNLWEKTPAAVKRGLAGALSVMPPSFWLGKAFREQLAFAENALAYSATLSFVQGKVNTLTRALKGE